MRCHSERSEESVSTPLYPPTTVILTLNEMKGKNLGVDYVALSPRACPEPVEGEIQVLMGIESVKPNPLL